MLTFELARGKPALCKALRAPELRYRAVLTQVSRLGLAAV